MRIYALWLLTIGLMVYAWRNWFVSLCGLLLMSVVMQRQDFPQYLLGINGLNPWNLLFLSVFLAWLVHRFGSGIPLDLPRRAAWPFIAFLLLIFIAWARAVVDLAPIPPEFRPDVTGFTGEFLLNRIKFIVPALVLFDACRTRRRVYVACGIVLVCALAYAALVIKFVPLHTLFSGSASEFMRYRHRVDRDVGLMAIDMSMMLAGGFWALVCFAWLGVRRRGYRIVLLLAAAVVFLAMALCQSRGSYLGFAAAGLVLAAVRWRKALVGLPIAVVLLFLAMPAIPARLSMGLDERSVTGGTENDLDVITAGRATDLWPPTIDVIEEQPVFGYGGLGTLRSDLIVRWYEAGVETPPNHPHNAYLELLVDMGFIGFVPIMVLYGGVFLLCLKLFRVRDDPLHAAIGGMGLSCITVLLVTALGAQTFYPTQSTIIYWCLWGLALRVYIARRRAVKAAAAAAPASAVASYQGRFGPPSYANAR